MRYNLYQVLHPRMNAAYIKTLPEYYFYEIHISTTRSWKKEEFLVLKTYVSTAALDPLRRQKSQFILQLVRFLGRGII